MTNTEILILPYTPTLSHLSRPLAIANELRSRGHSILFAGQSPKTRFIRDEGFETVPLFEPDEQILYSNIRNGVMRFVQPDILKRMINADLELFKRTKPSLVLSDGRFSAPISTQVAATPHAAIVNASSTAYRSIPYVPLFLSEIEFIKRFLGCRECPLLDSLNLKLEMLVFDNTMRAFKELSRQYGIERNVTATNCLTGKDLTLLADLPEYFPSANLPDSYHYIGPLTWMPTLPLSLPDWWPPPKDGRRLLYVTMGTTGVPEFFGRIAETFAKGDTAVVVTTGGQSAGIKTSAPDLYVTDYLDGDQVMQVSDLVICHGGNGTVYQALKNGKPIIGVPTLPDQAFNMRRVEALGLGKTMELRTILNDPEALVDLVADVLNDGAIANNVVRARENIATWDPVKLGADHIEDLLLASK